jgi:basic membrane protein A
MAESTQRTGREMGGGMKRAFRLAAAATIFVLIAAACSKSTTGSTGGSPTGPKVKVALLYDLVGRGDKSFNDSAAVGLEKAEGEFNLDAKELTPNAGGTNRDELIDLAVSGGYKLIIGVGFLYAPNFGAAAAKNPDIKFGDVDG